MNSTTPGRSRPWKELLVCALALMLGTCGERFMIAETYVDPQPVPAGGEAEIGLQVRYPPQQALYRWRAQRGVCEPQESHRLTTRYTAPDLGGEADRVTVEVLSHGEVIAAREIVIYIREQTVQKPASPPQGSPPASPAIRVTRIPEQDGYGPTRTERIAGVVSGIDVSDYHIVIYACTDMCYVQPFISAPLTEIQPDGTWQNLTHLGDRYLVLLAPSRFEPPATLWTIGESLNGVVTRVVAEGK